MSAGHLIAEWIARILPFHNPRTVCPPGWLRPQRGREPFVIVASRERSGTHLLMDAIFNNFPVYRKSPLYLDLLVCEWERRFPSPECLADCRGYVVKTHYDDLVYAGSVHRQRILDLIALGAVVLVLERDPEALKRSQRTFLGSRFDEEEFDRRSRSYFEFWEPLEDLRVKFEDLIDPQGFARVVAQLAEVLGIPPTATLHRPKGPDQALENYLNKLCTRLLGWRAPVISSGIGFRRTRHP